MKKFASVLGMGLAVVLMTASCGNDTPTNITIDSPDKVRAGSAQSVSATQEMETFTLNGTTLKISAADIMTAQGAGDNANADAADIANLRNSMMAADKEAQLLDVKFNMSDAPVDNGMFVFGIETEDAKNLTMQMYDEEGFGMVANNQFQINKGENYKALNVNALDNGSYVFRLKDDNGKELQKTVVVESKN
jgi:hypothetical protein